MHFSSEDELQTFLHWALGGEREVKLSSACRIDLRLDEYDIEIKPVLTRPALDKAAGQLMRYSPYAEGRKQVIAGLAPDNFTDAIARQIDSLSDAGIEVWVVDQIEFFQNAYADYFGQTEAEPMPTENGGDISSFIADEFSSWGYENEGTSDEVPDGVFAWALGLAFLLFLLWAFTPQPQPIPQPLPPSPYEHLGV